LKIQLHTFGSLQQSYEIPLPVCIAEIGTKLSAIQALRQAGNRMSGGDRFPGCAWKNAKAG